MRHPTWIFIRLLCLPFVFAGMEAWGIGNTREPSSLGGKCHKAVIGVEQTADYAMDWWIPRHKAILERNQAGDVDVILLGDSITQGWEQVGRQIWNRFFKDLKAVNMGFGGDKTQHVIWRIDHGELDGIEPRLVVLLVGTNNAWDGNHRETVDGIEEIILKIRYKLPNAKILLHAIFPRGEIDDPKRRVNEKANTLLPDLADNEWVYFLDFNDRFMKPDGTLMPLYNPDQVHLNEVGYEAWATALKPELERILHPKHFSLHEKPTGERKVQTYRPAKAESVPEITPGMKKMALE